MTHTVAVVGAGAAGTLVAARLAEAAAARRTPVRVALIDPAPVNGRGVAYGTNDLGHLLNVPAGRMSADPTAPDDFVRWLDGRRGGKADPGEYAPRAEYGRYLDDHITGAFAKHTDFAELVRVQERVVGVEERGAGPAIRFASGGCLQAQAVVLALGVFAPGVGWAPAALSTSPRFVADPWLAGALDAVPEDEDVLVVGAGLTAVDVALTLSARSRVVHMTSRNGLLPQPHLAEPGPVPPLPELPAELGLAGLRRTVLRHVRATVRAGGHWQSAVDSLRPVTSKLWQQLPIADRESFLTGELRMWEVHRHRVSPAVHARLGSALEAGRVRLTRGQILDADVGPGGVAVRLSSGETRTVGAVVNCTGGQADPRAVGDPLVRQLLGAGLVCPGPCGVGFDTADDGRNLPRAGRAPAALWSVGSLRRGNLWECTAMPEIRQQAADLATAVLTGLTSVRVRRWPADRYGQTLHTGSEAASAYDRGLGRVLRLESGADELVRESVEIDPGFALGHATLALLGREWGADVDTAAALKAARESVLVRGDARERSFVDAVGLMLEAPGGALALLRHVEAYPRDALAVSMAVPTVAFCGVTTGPHAWQLIEGLHDSYGDDWWYQAQLAFVRQDQERWVEAEELSSRSLAAEPRSGHAVHARTHVFYETDEHRAGLSWLDGWIGDHGEQAATCAHFSWHAALHEIALGDHTAVRSRYAEQLAPPRVSGARALVDSASLLWRFRLNSSWPGPLPIDAVLKAAPQLWLARPPTPFAALHSAIALAAAGDTEGLDELCRYAREHELPTFPRVVAPLCAGLAAVVERDWPAAVDLLAQVQRDVVALGGSAAQREVVEDTLRFALAATQPSLVDAGEGRR